MKKIYKLFMLSLLMAIGGTMSSVWAQTEITQLSYVGGCETRYVNHNMGYLNAYYGNNSPSSSTYVDLSNYGILRLEGEQGTYRVFFNDGTEYHATIGVDGFVDIDLANFRVDNVVHLNGLKSFGSGAVPRLYHIYVLGGRTTSSSNDKTVETWDFTNSWSTTRSVLVQGGDWVTKSTTIVYHDGYNNEAITYRGTVVPETNGLKASGTIRTDAATHIEVMSGATLYIPVTKGAYVKVTGQASGAPRTFTWGNVVAQPTGLFETGGSKTLEATARENGYVSIYTGTDGRYLLVYTIEVYTPTNNMSFGSKSVVLRNNENYWSQAVSNGTNVTYSCEVKGELSASIDSSNGNVYNISGNGGAVVVTATQQSVGYLTNSADNYYYQAGMPTTAQYVITKPYSTHEWSFYSEITKVGDTETKAQMIDNVAGASEWGLTWKIRRYTNDNAHTLYYIVNSVMASTVPVAGDNARFLDASAGLLVSTNDMGADNKGAYGFGADIATTDLLNGSKNDPANSAIMNAYTLDDAYNFDDVSSAALTIRNGSTLTIPALKKGQHIRFRWNRYSTGGVGDRMLATNVTDLAGVSMNYKYFYLGSGSNELSKAAHQEFIVENDGDVSFTLSQDGWADIYNIKVGEVGEFIDTDLNIGIASGNNPDKQFDWVASNGHVDLYTYLRRAGQQDLSTTFTDVRGTIHLQSSLDQVFEIVNRTGSLTESNCYMDGNTLVINKGAHGRFTLIEKGTHFQGKRTTNSGTDTYTDVEHPYLLDSLHTEVRVYEYDYNVKQYPYTWAMEHFNTSTGNDTKNKLSTDAYMSGYHHWTAASGDTKVYNFGQPENLIAWVMNNYGTPSGSVTYAVSAGEKFASRQVVPVYGNGEEVAKVIYGVYSPDGNTLAKTFTAASSDNSLSSKGFYAYSPGNTDNGSAFGGTVYAIYPKYSGTIEVNVVLNPGKNFYILENDVALERYNGVTVSAKYQGTYTFPVKAGATYKIYATGSKLGFYGFKYDYVTAYEEPVPELNGLGIMPAEYWNEADTDLQLNPDTEGLKLSNGRVYKITVPSVQSGETLYLAVTGDTNGSSVAVGSETGYISRVNTGIVYYHDWSTYIENSPLNIYKINGWGGDIDLYLKNLTLKKVAVSVNTKNVSAAGYATEAREYPVDYTLAYTFLGTKQTAYKVTGVDHDYGSHFNAGGKVNVAPVLFVPATWLWTEPNTSGVMVTGDVANTYGSRSATYWPLFTTDINTPTSDMSGNKLVGVVLPSDIPYSERDQENKDGILDQRKIKGDYTYWNYMLAAQGYTVTYDEEDYTKEDVIKEQISGLGFYLVMKKGTELNGVPYAGGLPNHHTAYMQLTSVRELDHQGAEAKRRALEEGILDSKDIQQVYFLDEDEIATGIERIQQEETLEEVAPVNGRTFETGVFYTLQGIPVTAPTKGFYIYNGKKVFVK